jgi:hypothetical protein
MIVSVSRRCDIPRFQFDWFMEKLDAGFVEVKNPFNAAQVRRVSLQPEDVEALVFWTRDPGAILANAGELEKRGYCFYVMVTLTGYPAVLEPNVPAAESVVQKMGMLAQKITRNRVIWRYDPVFLSDKTGFEFHRRNFACLAGRLRGTVNRVIISLYDDYRSAKRRIGILEKDGIFSMAPAADSKGLLPETKALFSDIASAAHEAGMEIQGCAEADLEPLGIRAGACIDGDLIRGLRGIEAAKRDKNQRPSCLCASSVDIGRYGSCQAGCVYCYASP